jgi:thioredoxin 2
MDLACPRCLAVNRVAEDQIGEGPKCQACSAPLLPAEVVTLTAESFDPFILHAGLPVLVEFRADECGPCEMMAPIFDSVAAEMKGRVRFARLDAAAHPQVPMRHHLRGVPSLMLFRDGAEVARTTGAMEAQALRRWLASQGIQQAKVQ